MGSGWRAKRRSSLAAGNHPAVDRIAGVDARAGGSSL